MYQYIYKPADAGFNEWPSGTLRLEGIQVTDSPDEADVFVFPGNLSLFKDDLGRLDRLPFMSRGEERHVFLDVSDNFTAALKRKCIFIRCDARSWMLNDDVNLLQVGWPVEDYSECVELPEGGFKHDVSFQGWLSTQTRIDSSRACWRNPELKSDIATYTDFTGYLHDRTTGHWNEEGLRRRFHFRRSMKESRISLCPESIPGVLPYRFFEAMSAGRVPLLVSSDFVLPFAELIPYAEFCKFLPAADASRADEAVLDFVHSYTDEAIVEMGLKARYWWKDFLDSRDWPRTMAEAVIRKLAASE